MQSPVDQTSVSDQKGLMRQRGNIFAQRTDVSERQGFTEWALNSQRQNVSHILECAVRVAEGFTALGLNSQSDKKVSVCSLQHCATQI